MADLEGVDILGPLDRSRILPPITSGPNRGYVSVDPHNILLHRAYRISRYVTKENPHKDIQIKNRWHNRGDALINQKWGDPNILFNAVVQHETYGVGGRIGHQQGFEQAIQGDVCGNIALRLERIAGSSDRVGSQVHIAMSHALDYISFAQSHERVHSHVPSAGAPIVMRSSSNPAPLQATYPQEQKQLHPGPFPSTCEFELLGKN